MAEILIVGMHSLDGASATHGFEMRNGIGGM